MKLSTETLENLKKAILDVTIELDEEFASSSDFEAIREYNKVVMGSHGLFTEDNIIDLAVCTAILTEIKLTRYAEPIVRDRDFEEKDSSDDSGYCSEFFGDFDDSED